MNKVNDRIKHEVESLGYYLYGIETEKQGKDDILRILIENDTYINIDDCVAVSQHLSPILDDLNPYENPYMLEVTSAGAERELRNDEEIKRAVNKFVHVKTIEQTFEGTLVKVNEGFITLKQKNNKTVEVNLIDVSIIRLAINL